MAVVEKRMRQREAAERLGVTQRQVKRLAARYRVAGVAGLASRRRGQRPNNAIAEAKRGAILELVRKLADFPPTLAHEKLTEGHGYRLSVETLRGWLMRRVCGSRRRGGELACIRHASGAPAWGNWCRSTARRTTGSRAVRRAAACWRSWTTRAAVCWRCGFGRRRRRRPHADLAGVPSAARPAGCLVLASTRSSGSTDRIARASFTRALKSSTSSPFMPTRVSTKEGLRG